jgi:membrane protease YdiL (CAAX protease family)
VGLALAASLLLTGYGFAVKCAVLAGALTAPQSALAARGLAVVSLVLDLALVGWKGGSASTHLVSRLRGASRRAVARGAVLALLFGAAVFAAVALGTGWLGASLVPAEFATMTAGGLARKVLVRDPLLVAVPEELAFRLLLWDLFVAAAAARGLPRHLPLAGTTVVFGAWHVADGLPLGPPAMLGAALLGAVGGAVIGALYARTRSLPLAVFAHAVADAAIALARFALTHS